MAVTIVDVNSTTFSINGIEYLKNFLSIVEGDNVKILNVYDSNVILQKLTNYTEYTVNAAGFASAILLQATLKDVLFKRDSLGGTIYDTVAAMVTGQPQAGTVVTTLGYRAVNDGGGNTYRIVDDAALVEDFGAIINTTGNIYAVALDLLSLNNKHFGIFSDSTTAWPITNFQEFTGMLLAAVNYGITIESPAGTYFNMSLNMSDNESGAQIHFRDAVFANLVHVVGTDINNQIEGMFLTGHVTTYDRYGTTFAKNILGGLNITCKSDIAIHPTASVGRGVHIYHTTINHHYGSIVIEFAGASGSNVEAAFALDGEETSTTNDAPRNHTIESVHVIDTDVRGAQITGTGHNIGTIQVDRYGSSTFSDSLTSLGTTSWNGETVSQIAQGVLIWNSDCHVEQIIVDQKDGFTGRLRALTDVAIGRGLLSTSPTVEKRTTPTIGNIISRNPQRQSLSVGEYQNISGLDLGSIQIDTVDANNIMELDASGERAIYGLVDCYYGTVNIGRLFCYNPKQVTMLMQRDVYSSGTQRQNVAVIVGVLHTPIIAAQVQKYDIWQGDISYIIAWNDPNNKGLFRIGINGIPVDLNNTQTITGIKTWDVDIQLAGAKYLKGTATAGTSRIHGINGTTEWIGSIDKNVTVTNLGSQTDVMRIRTNSITAIDIDANQKTTIEKDFKLAIVPTYADDAAAGVGGLGAGDVYKTATGEIRIKL